MLTLNDGRSELWQWDTGRTLTVDADCSQVHFSNKVFGRSIDVDVADGMAIIPDILLQSDKDLTAWAFVGTAENGYTKISSVFKVNKRNKPADYVFTPADQTTLEEIKEKLGYLESIQDPDAIKDAVDDYLEQNPVESPVQSVNGKTGKVDLIAEDVGAISKDDLQEATNEALAQAKASGEFNGKDGIDGVDGKDGKDGQDYVLTDEDKTEIAEQAAALVEVPDSGGNVDLTGYATEQYVKDYAQPKGNYLTEVPEGYAKTEDIPTKPEDIGAQPSGNYLTEVPSGYATEEFVKNKIAEAELGGEEVDLSGYAQKSELPTKVSQLQNDSGYLTAVPDGYAKTEDIPKNPADIGAQPEGDYALRSEIPSVPVKSVNGKTGAVSLTATDVKARPDSWMPTASDVGALPKSTVIPTVPTKVSAFDNDAGYLTEHQDLSEYAKKTEIPSVPVKSVNGKTGAVSLTASDVKARPDTWMPSAQEVGALPNTYTPPNQTAEQVGADPKGTATAAVSQHNTADDSHNDIRLELKAINDRLNAFFDSDNQTLDELSEIVAYITSNKSLIDSITTSKVSVADIVNNLTSNVTNKPLSAAQGVVLKGLIDTLSGNLANYQPKGNYALRSELPKVPTNLSAFTNDSGFITGYTETDPTVPAWAKQSTKPSYSKSEVGLGNVDNVKQYSENNPPPYPVTSVNGQTGAVMLDIPGSYTIPSFWQSAVDTAIVTIKSLQNGKNCVTFPFFSDNHQRNGYAGALIAHIMQECHIPFCFYGGDSISNGTIANEAEMIAQDKAFDTMMAAVPNGRLCRAVGNHDGYWYDGTNKYYYDRNQVYELFLREEAIAQNKQFGDDGTYYYVEDISSKVRFVVLNTNGGSVDDAQIAWFRYVALKVDEGWAVVVISHQPISNHYHAGISNAAAVRTVVTESGVEMIGWFSGHIHRDRIYTGAAVNTSDDSEGADMGFKQVTITSDHTSIAYDDATKHTVKEDALSHAIDFVTINRDTKMVNLTRLGIGNSREYRYGAEPEPTYTNLATEFQEGHRLNSSGGTTAQAGATTVLDYIPAVQGDIIRVRGFGTLDDYNISFYKSDKTILESSKPSGWSSGYSYDSATETATVTVKNTHTAFVRVSGALTGTTADVIITKNEEIV